jgi:hypothetical protein
MVLSFTFMALPNIELKLLPKVRRQLGAAVIEGGFLAI